jgi:hypothetical protein
MAIARMGALLRSIEMQVRPKYGRGTVNDTGCMTKPVDRMKNTKVTMEKRVIIVLGKLSFLGHTYSCQNNDYVCIATAPTIA